MATLRQVERFAVTFSAAASSTTFTLATTLLDTTKAFLIFGIRNNLAQNRKAMIRGEITNTTTLTFRRTDATATTTEIVGYVVEYTAGVTVERGTETDIQAAGNEVTLTSITDITKAFHTQSIERNSTNYSATDPVASFLLDDGDEKIRFEINSNTSNFVDWQVIQYDDCSVQRGSITGMNSTTISVTAAPSAVDLGKTWLRFSYRGESITSNDIGSILLRGRFTSTTQITIDRDHHGSIAVSDIRWETIEFTDSVTVEEILSAFTSSETLQDETITEVSDLTKSIALASQIQRGGLTDYTANDKPGASWFTLDLTTKTNLQIKRTAALGTADVAAYVIDFGAAAGAVPVINLVMAPYTPT